jgi:hypothetical protein
MNWEPLFWFALATIAVVVTARRLRKTIAWWLAAVTILGIAVFVAVFSVRSAAERGRYGLRLSTGGAGQLLITKTNASQWVQMDQGFQISLSNLLRSPTQIAEVLLGDEPHPTGDGRASSRLILTNELGQALGIRLRLRHGSAQESPYQVLSYWKPAEPIRAMDGTQPLRSETDQTPQAAGSRH